MHLRACLILAAAACAFGGRSAGAAPVRSASVAVLTTPEILQWNTIRQDQPVLHWAWPDGAASAVVTVSTVTRSLGRARTAVAVVERGTAPVADWTLPVSRPSQDADTGVVSVDVVFHAAAGGAGVALADETLRADALGLARGTAGETVPVCACATTDPSWSRQETLRGALLAIPAGTTNVTFDGASVARVSVPGWACPYLPPWRNVSCARDGSTDASATLYRYGSGLTILFR